MRKKILLKGPLLTRSGYGEQTRFALRALRTREDLFDIFIQPLTWGQTSWDASDTEERKWIDQVIERTIIFIQQGGQFDMSLQVTIPNEWERMAPVNVGYTAGIETTKVAPQWLQKGNEMVDKIIVVSNHAKQVYLSTEYDARASDDNGEVIREMKYRLETPIDVVNYPAKPPETSLQLDLDLHNDFNFLVVAQFGPRKNVPDTIKWYVEEFKDEDVGIVIKSNIAKNCTMDREKMYADMKTFVNGLPEHKCKIYLLHGDMSDEEVQALYNHSKIKALVALPHGEGFGLPIFEAAYSGLPVVATGWSGQLDFLIDSDKNDCFYNVSFDLQPVQENVIWDGVIIKESMWAYPREQSAKKQMRACYEDLTSGPENFATERAEKLAARIQDEFAPEKKYKEFCDAVLEEESVEIENWLATLEEAPEDEIVEYE